MRVLLTGASGFVGAHVAAELGRQGASVRAYCRSEPPPHAHVGDWVSGDVRDLELLKRATAGCEAVVHAAALVSYVRSDAAASYEVNVSGTRNAIEAAAAAGARRVLVTSSAATCGPAPGRAASERDRPTTWELRIPYPRTKVLAEKLALQAAAADGLDVLCVNPTTVVGASDSRPTPAGRMIRDLVNDRYLGYVRTSGINVVGVGDVARGHVLALDRGRSGQRYILGGENLSLRDAFAMAMEAIGERPPSLPLPWSAVYGAALGAECTRRLTGRDPQLLVLDEVRLGRMPLFFSSDRARAELGYEPHPAAEALASAARWFAGTRRPSAGRRRVLTHLRPSPLRRPAGHW
jgi:dihydroflavonol-4-reductase